MDKKWKFIIPLVITFICASVFPMARYGAARDNELTRVSTQNAYNTKSIDKMDVKVDNIETDIEELKRSVFMTEHIVKKIWKEIEVSALDNGDR